MKNHHDNYTAAMCTQICENEGICIAPDVCECQETFGGVNCELREF